MMIASEKAILDYVLYANKGKGISNNNLLLKNRSVNIIQNGQIIASYNSDIQIEINIASGHYFLTIMDDLLGSFLHKCIFWTTKYDFQFDGESLSYQHEQKTVEVY